MAGVGERIDASAVTEHLPRIALTRPAHAGLPPRARDTARATVRVVGHGVDAAGPARGRPHRTVEHARPRAAQLPRPAWRSAVAAVGGAALDVDASIRRALHHVTGTDAGAEVALLTRWTCVVARPAVRGVRLKIHTGAAAIVEAGAALRRAAAAGADLGRHAFDAARATVVRVRRKGHARAGALGEAGRADAGSVGAALVRATGLAAGAAVGAVTAHVHALALAADGEAGGAADGAETEIAHLPGRALDAATSAVLAIGAGVDADAVARGLARGAARSAAVRASRARRERALVDAAADGGPDQRGNCEGTKKARHSL